MIKRAKEILALVESKDTKEVHNSPKTTVEDVQLGFGDIRGDEIIEALKNMDLSTVTPIEALNKLYEFQNIAKK